MTVVLKGLLVLRDLDRFGVVENKRTTGSSAFLSRDGGALETVVSLFEAGLSADLSALENLDRTLDTWWSGVFCIPSSSKISLFVVSCLSIFLLFLFLFNHSYSYDVCPQVVLSCLGFRWHGWP